MVANITARKTTIAIVFDRGWKSETRRGSTIVCTTTRSAEGTLFARCLSRMYVLSAFALPCASLRRLAGSRDRGEVDQRKQHVPTGRPGAGSR